jgi:carbonic anhydrase
LQTSNHFDNKSTNKKKMRKFSVGLIVLAVVVAVAVASGPNTDQLLFRARREGSRPVKHWGYRNEDRSLLPKDWHKHHQKCYGSKQSPINVESRATAYDSTLAQININQVRSSGENENGEETEKWEIKNNGHSGM